MVLLIKPIDSSDKYGFIDKTGKIVIPCQWKSAKAFSQGVAAVEKEGFSLLGIKEKDKWGFIDKTGKIVISCKWKAVNSFREDRAVVKDFSDLYGFIDIKGMVIIPCKWKGAHDFSEGVAKVTNKDLRDRFIDKNGKVIWKYDRTLSYKNDLYSVCNLNGKYGIIDINNKIVIPFKWKSITFSHEGLAGVQDFGTGKYGFINETGKIVIPCQWKTIGEFREGLASVQDFISGKYGFIDKTGKIVIPCLWKSVDGIFHDGIAYVQDFVSEKYGFIDKNGKIILPCQWIYASSFRNGLAVVKQSTNRTVMINTNGEVIYHDVGKEGRHHMMPVRDDKRKYGYVDTWNHKLVIPCKWKEAEPFDIIQAKVKDFNDKVLYIDTKGHVK